jgi:hypothetical protein
MVTNRGAATAVSNRIESAQPPAPVASTAVSALPRADEDATARVTQLANLVRQAEQARSKAEDSLRSLSSVHTESLEMLRAVQAERDEVRVDLDWLKAEVAAQSAAGSSSFVRRWQFLGPLTDAQALALRDQVERDPLRSDFETAGVRGPVRWTLYESPDDRIALERICNHRDKGVCYLTSWVYVPEPRQVQFSLGSDDGFALWINRQRVLEKRGLRSASPAQDKVAVDLVAGWNQLLANIDNAGGNDWAFYCEIRQPQGEVPLRLLTSPAPPRRRRRDTAALPAADD